MSFLSYFRAPPVQQSQEGELVVSTEGVDPQKALVDTRTPEEIKEEKRYVRKLDLFLLLFGCVSQVIKYLDQNNISSAYVSGMSEDLGFKGNELNFFTTWFNVGYCIFLIPSQVILTYVRPSLWLPGLELGWGILTGLIAVCSTAKQIYALRTFIGVFESSAYPGTITLFMMWYTPPELAKRIGFYHSCQAIGSIVSGLLTTAVYETMDNYRGLAGWRWLFIINAIMTIVLAFFGFFMIPDMPNKPNPWSFWFNARDREIAAARAKRYGRAEAKTFTFGAVKRAVKQPLIYFFAFLYVGTVLAAYGQNYFNLFLKSLKNPDGSKVWTVAQLNLVPIGGNVMTVVFVWVWAFASDFFQTRWLIVVAQCTIGLIPSIIMSIWNVPLNAKYFSYFVSYVILATAPPYFAWLSDMCPHDAEQRAFIMGTTIAAYYAISAWSQVLIWPAKQAPHYKYGWKVSVGLFVALLIGLFTLRIIDLRYIRPQNYRLAQEKKFREADEAREAEGLDSEGDVKEGFEPEEDVKRDATVKVAAVDPQV